MDVNKNKILLKGNNNIQRRNKEISLISPRNNQNNNMNKIGLVININNQKRLCNSNDNLKTKKNNNKRTLNELTLNCLERENSLLKKEIEIVKSNLIISDKKEQINKKTLQEIKKMNKQKEISYKNMFESINEYKKNEINYVNKIKELEAQSQKKELELNNEIYSCKLELEKKDKIINELNNKLEELKERIINLKKIINEKNRILLFLTNKNKTKKCKRINSLNNILNARTMVSSKSCGNIINKIFGFKNTFDNSSINKIKKHHSKSGLKEILLNEENNQKNENENNKIKIIRKQSYYRKRIPKNIKQINGQSINHMLKKYNSNKNINEHNSNNSLNNSLKNIEQNINTNVNLSSNRKKNKLMLSNDNSNIKEIFINQRNNNINEIKNYSFILTDLEKHKNQIKTSKEIAKNTMGNKKLKPENMKVSYSTKNKLIEINKKFMSNNSHNNSNNNPSFISNFSFQSIFPSFQK